MAILRERGSTIGMVIAETLLVAVTAVVIGKVVAKGMAA